MFLLDIRNVGWLGWNGIWCNDLFFYCVLLVIEVGYLLELGEINFEY